MKKQCNKFIFLTAMLSFVVNLFPVYTWAEGLTDASAVSKSVVAKISADNSTTYTTFEASPSVVREEVSLRGMYEKHFLLSDGSFLVASYNEPVHYEDNGLWKEIDNSLILRTDTSGISRYETVDGLTDISFAQQFQNKLVIMEQGDYAIAWGVSPQRNLVAGDAVSTSEQKLAPIASLLTTDLSSLNAEEQKTLAVKTSSALRYNSALGQNVDLEYTVLPSRIKESIILNSPQDIAAYTIGIETTGLRARLLDSRQVEFYNKNDEVIFTMWAPYMYDNAGALSEDIQVKLVCTGEGKYVVSIVPNADWLKDHDRRYPVVIDPDISSNHIEANLEDNYVVQGEGVQNGNLDRLYFGNRSNGLARAFFKYINMPDLPPDAIIINAIQTLSITNGTSSANPIDISIVLSDWSEDNISWDNMPEETYAYATNVNHNNLTTYSFECTDVVEGWYCGTITGQCSNYGWMLQYSDETINDYNAVYSSDYSVKAKRPLLSIRYHTESDLFWPAPDHYQINSKWGYRNFDSDVHRGIDIDCNGLTLIASISGSVSTFYDPSAGYSLVIHKTDSSFQVRYYHLKNGGYIVSDGNVEAGDAVAISGNTGSSTGPHLHFQLQWGNDKYKSYNPLETYHPNDQRSTWTNPNPMFIYCESIGAYVPNHYFDYSYVASDYNSTDVSWART